MITLAIEKSRDVKKDQMSQDESHPDFVGNVTKIIDCVPSK